MRIEEYVLNTRLESELMIRTLFAQALVELNRCIVDRGDSKIFEGQPIESFQYDTKIVEIVWYIQEHLDEDLSLARIGERFALSKHYLCRLFKRNTGYTVYGYIINRRIRAAAHFLAKGHPPFEAADLSEFNDYGNFYKAFRRATGYTPNQFVVEQQSRGSDLKLVSGS